MFQKHFFTNSPLEIFAGNKIVGLQVLRIPGTPGGCVLHQTQALAEKFAQALGPICFTYGAWSDQSNQRMGTSKFGKQISVLYPQGLIFFVPFGIMAVECPDFYPAAQSIPKLPHDSRG